MKKVLLADGDPAIRAALRLLLERRLEHISLAEVPDFQSLERLLVDFNPEILLLDWRLPGIGDRAALIRALQQQPGLRIVVLSVREEDRAQALSSGAVGFIYKGDSPEQVLDQIRSVLS